MPMVKPSSTAIAEKKKTVTRKMNHLHNHRRQKNTEEKMQKQMEIGIETKTNKHPRQDHHTNKSEAKENIEAKTEIGK